MRRQRFPVMLAVKERKALEALAYHEGLSKAAIIRRLLRLEARKRGLWPLDQPDARAREVQDG